MTSCVGPTSPRRSPDRRPALLLFLALAGAGLSAEPVMAHPPLPGTIRRLEARVAERPDDPDLRLVLAQHWLHAGEPTRAEREFARCLELRPEYAEWIDAIRAGGDRLRTVVAMNRAARAALPPPAAGGTPLVTRGPYLQMGNDIAMTFRWRTDAAVGSRVRVGETPGAWTATEEDTLPTTEHELRVTGLLSDRRYYYAVGTPTEDLAGGDPAHTFRTAPPPGTSRRMRLWVIGDSGAPLVGSHQVRDGYTAFNGSLDADLWLMLGDNAYNTGTDAEYQAAVFDTYPTLLRRSVLWPTHGNHDVVRPGALDDYYDFFTLPTAGECGGVPSGSEAYYAFDHGNVHFICLDSQDESRAPNGPMLTWLAQDLAATTREWLVAFWHHPPYSKGSHDSDTDTGGKQREMRENALPLLEAAGVDLVLTGHSHSYERSFLLDGHYGLSSTLTPAMKKDDGDGRLLGDGAYVKPTAGPAPHEGTVYAVAGSSSQIGGGPLNHPVMIASLNLLGSLVLDLDGLVLDGRFIDVAGIVRDDFRIVKGGASAVSDPPAAAPRLAVTCAPNPFQATTRIAWTLPEAGRIEIRVFDIQGRLVASLVDGVERAGAGAVVWDGRDGGGQPAATGAYLVVTRFDGRVVARKLVRRG